MKATNLLAELNRKYYKLHRDYEELFWVSYMGDHSVDKRMNAALHARDQFRSDTDLRRRVESAMEGSAVEERERLSQWARAFSLYQIPAKAAKIRKKISDIESSILKHHTTRREGYIDPQTGEFVEASGNKMRLLAGTHPNEKLRRAAFEASEKLSIDSVDRFVELVKLRNEFARLQGYSDFFDYKCRIEELEKDDVTRIFHEIYERTKYGFNDLRLAEKKKPGLRKPWNRSFMLAGSFIREEDQYLRMEDALRHWGRSFAALGIDYRGGTLTLDLMDRKGKYSNGFCHWPRVVIESGGKLLPGASNFTANAVAGQVGAGAQGLNTLFHEGGHAAHYLNSDQKDSILNTEYPPASTAWAETQSMFMDSISSSIEWRMRYSKNTKGERYPFDLWVRKAKATHTLRPLGLMGIMMVTEFERMVYEDGSLTESKVLDHAKQVGRKYLDYSEDSYRVLGIPHIYAFESSGYYHNYGLAELAVSQWTEYFRGKYGHIADNPAIGPEMAEVWKLGSSKSFPYCIAKATGRPLSPEAYLTNATLSVPQMISRAKKRISAVSSVPEFRKKIDLNAKIRMVHGKKVIATNRKSFEEMDGRYRSWLKTLA